jgi:rubrerythrin
MGVPYVGISLMVLSFFSFMYLGTMLLKGNGEKKYRDPYDLGLLKEIHERASWEEADMHIPENADVVCPHCGHLYGQKLKICPMCKRLP